MSYYLIIQLYCLTMLSYCYQCYQLNSPSCTKCNRHLDSCTGVPRAIQMFLQGSPPAKGLKTTDLETEYELFVTVLSQRIAHNKKNVLSFCALALDANALPSQLTIQRSKTQPSSIFIFISIFSTYTFSTYMLWVQRAASYVSPLNSS